MASLRAMASVRGISRLPFWVDCQSEGRWVKWNKQGLSLDRHGRVAREWDELWGVRGVGVRYRIWRYWLGSILGVGLVTRVRQSSRGRRLGRDAKVGWGVIGLGILEINLGYYIIGYADII